MKPNAMRYAASTCAHRIFHRLSLADRRGDVRRPAVGRSGVHPAASRTRPEAGAGMMPTGASGPAGLPPAETESAARVPPRWRRGERRGPPATHPQPIGLICLACPSSPDPLSATATQPVVTTNPMRNASVREYRRLVQITNGFLLDRPRGRRGCRGGPAAAARGYGNYNCVLESDLTISSTGIGGPRGAGGLGAEIRQTLTRL